MIGSGRNRRRYAARPALAAVLAALAMGACTPNDGTAPTTAPTTTTPSATSPGSSATPPSTASATPSTSLAYPADVPAAARARTQEGAQEFAKHYFERINQAWTRPQAGLLPPICESTSKSCANSEQTAVRLVSSGLRYDQRPLTVLGVTSVGEQDGLATVYVKGRQEARSVVDSSGRPVQQVQAADVTFEVIVAWSGDHWLVRSVRSST